MNKFFAETITFIVLFIVLTGFVACAIDQLIS